MVLRLATVVLQAIAWWDQATGLAMVLPQLDHGQIPNLLVHVSFKPCLVIIPCKIWIRLPTAVDCGDPGAPEKGVKQGGTYTLNSKVQFKCQPGYKLTGATEITCQTSGSWSGDKPSCTGEFNKLIS